jgi:hypothetical protein
MHHIIKKILLQRNYYYRTHGLRSTLLSHGMAVICVIDVA